MSTISPLNQQQNNKSDHSIPQDLHQSSCEKSVHERLHKDKAKENEFEEDLRKRTEELRRNALYSYFTH